MVPLRVVLDTNIVVSGALKPTSLQRTVLVLAMAKPALLYISHPILDEYAEVLARPELKIRTSLRLQMLQLIENASHVMKPTRRVSVCGDPDDNIFLECADAARADYLVTGNLRHFPTFWKSTKVVTSRDLIGLVAPHLLR